MNKFILIAASILLLSGCANLSPTQQRMATGAATGGVLAGPVGAGVGTGVGYVVSKLEGE